MSDVAINGKPTAKPAYVSAARNGSGSRTMTQEWSNMSWVTNNQNAKRATRWKWWCSINTHTDGKNGARTNKSFLRTGSGNERTDMNRTYVEHNLSSFATGSQTLTRASFYPNTSRKLDSVYMTVAYNNSFGDGPHVRSTYTFKVPRKPALSAITYDEANGRIVTDVTVNAGEDAYEKYDVQSVVSSYDSSTKASTSKTTTSTADSFELRHDGVTWGNLTYGQYIKVRFKVRSRGYAGASEWVERVHYIAYPNQPVITGIVYDSTSYYSLIHVKVNLKRETEDKPQHPVDYVKLELLANTTASSASAAKLESGWEEMGQDDKWCNALALRRADCLPDRGNHSWVRIKTWHGLEDRFYRYSEPMELSELYRAPAGATADEDRAVILSIEPTTKITGAKLLIGWDGTDLTNRDSSTETEVSWSSDSAAWQSNEGPETWSFSASSGETTSGGVTYRKSRTVYIRGLEEGKKYYFKVRRIRDVEGEKIRRGPYDSDNVDLQAAATEVITNVSFSAPDTVMSGKDLRVSWDYDSDERQTGWRIVTGTLVTEQDEFGNSVYRIATSGRKVLAEGTDSRRVQTIAKKDYSGKVSNGQIWIAASVKVAGTFVDSEASMVSVLSKPSLSYSVSTLTAQPLALTFTSNDNRASMAIAIRSLGCAGDDAILMPDQLEGDTVWTALVPAEWTASGTSYTTTIAAPADLDLRDKCRYRVEATAVNLGTGMRSSTVSRTFTVRYSTKAKVPSPSITVTPSDTTDSSGIRRREATIQLAAPDNAAQTDLYDVYRVTVDGALPLVSDAPLDATVVDPYAPFGDSNLAYRVCSKTADGSVEWSDYAYFFGGRGVTGGEEVRIDFGDRYLECDRGVTMQTTWAKTFSQDGKLSGDVDGYWGAPVKRTSTIAGQLIKLYEQDKIEAARALAKHVGPCFVRTSAGEAFVADVQVSPLGIQRNTAGQTFSLKIAAIDPTDDYAGEVIIEEEEES